MKNSIHKAYSQYVIQKIFKLQCWDIMVQFYSASRFIFFRLLFPFMKSNNWGLQKENFNISKSLYVVLR